MATQPRRVKVRKVYLRTAPAKVKKTAERPTPLKEMNARESASGKVSKSGKVPSGDVRLTANVNRNLHVRLKILSAQLRKPVGEIIEGWIKEHIPDD